MAESSCSAALQGGRLGAGLKPGVTWELRMEPERWWEAERLCLLALEREEGERAAFLQEACGGDEALLREVESLLAQTH